MDPAKLEDEFQRVNPFNADHLDRLETIERKIEVFNEFARRAELCGVACKVQRQTIAGIQRGLNAIKKEFLAEFVTARNLS